MSAVSDNSLFGIVAVCFFGTWIALGIIGFVVFDLPRDVGVKRKWFPSYVILVGVLFIVFSTALGVLTIGAYALFATLAFAVPATVVMVGLNLACTKFCDKCGAKDFGLSAPVYCSKCGAKLMNSDGNPTSEV
jgi:hypothetical protein